MSKDSAHVGMVRDPSRTNPNGSGQIVCASCHSAITSGHQNSIHANQSGYEAQYLKRSGNTQQARYREMFSSRCNECHTTCGQCHVSSPLTVKGGLIAGHFFRKTPSQDLQCAACHGSRVGAEFRGENEGAAGDVHFLQGKDCMFCHTGTEMHNATGTTASPHRYNATNRASCTSCHAISFSGTAANVSHRAEHSRVQCQVCHSVTYKNCYSCHVELGSQGILFPSEMGFRIGRNPRADRPENDYVVVRHIPIAPDSFDPWGLAMPEYDADATWMMATPHNIQKFTPQNSRFVTDSLGTRQEPYCNNCHGQPGRFLTSAFLDSLINRGVMVAAERSANATVVTNPPTAR